MIQKLFEKDYFLSKNQAIVIEPRTPQPVYPEHTHDFNEIVIVTDGFGKHIINGHLYHLYPGMMFYVHATDSHLYEHVKNLHLTNILFKMPDKFTFINNINTLIPNHKNENSHYFLDKKCNDKIKKLVFELNDSTLNAPAYKESLFLQLLILLKENQYVEDGSGSSDQRVNQLLRWLQIHFKEQIDWALIAEKFALSSRTLHRKMKSEMNITPQRYLTKLRLAEAYFQLHYTESNITTIAQNCGFNDSSYFSTCFKNEFHITPKELRDNPS
ncbi:HTH-type transcriptional activator RhaS [Orbus mooreae]|uniref:HTH-type transcriptional activator RhaS n=1 Tax=Orbus mooreae TaxID=3074107 RepID=UPI00370D8DA4